MTKPVVDESTVEIVRGESGETSIQTSGDAHPFWRGATAEAASDVGGIVEFLFPAREGQRYAPDIGNMRQTIPGQRPGAIQETFAKGGSKVFEAITGEPDTGPATEGSRARVAERATAEGATGLLTAPVGGGFKGFSVLRRLAVEGFGAAVGGASSETAKQSGAGPTKQFFANLAGNFGALGAARVIKATGKGVFGGTAQLLSSSYRSAVADKLAPAIAQDLVHGSKDEAIARLTAELDRVSNPNNVVDLTPSQLLGEDLAPRLQPLEKALAKRGTAEADTLVLSLRKTREANKAAIEAYARQSLSPGAARQADIAMENFRQAASEMQRRVNEYFKHPSLTSNVDGAPTNVLKSEALAMVKEAGAELEDRLPKAEIDLITNYGETIDFQSLRRLQKRIGGRIRELEGTPGQKGSETVRYLTMLSGAVDDTFEALARATGTTRGLALKRAKDAYKEEKYLFGRLRSTKYGREVFKEKNPLVAAFMATDNTTAGFKNIWRSGKPTKHLTDLKRSLSYSPDPEGAWAGVQQLIMDEVIGENWARLSGGDFTGIRKALMGKEEAFDTAFGPGAVDNFREFLNYAEAGMRGALPEVAISNLKDVSKKSAFEFFIVPLVGFIRDITFGRYALAGGRLHSIGMGALPATWDVADSLMMQAMVDKSFLLELLQRPTKEGINHMALRARNLARTGRAFAVEVQDAKENTRQQEVRINP